MFVWLGDYIHIQAIGSVVLLVGFLIATNLLQQRAISQSKKVLESISERAKQTVQYQSAEAYINRRVAAPLFQTSAHKVAVWFLIIVVFACSVVTYFGAELIWKTPSYVLGGAKATGAPTADLARYQSSTVFIGSMAFLGAYIWTMVRLITRINNDDMSPTTYYFLSVRLLSACIVAGIARHIVEAIPLLKNQMYAGEEPLGLALLGFLIGWNPTLWINEIVLRASEVIKRSIPSQRWPAAANLPQNMTLSMIQGLVEEKIERLAELDIDNCQKLSRENAILIWLRTSYNLEVITDWVAQAQFCILFEDDKIQALRKAGIRDIFLYVDAISDQGARVDVQQILNIQLSVITSQRASILSDAAYQRLDELRTALRPSEINTVTRMVPGDLGGN